MADNIPIECTATSSAEKILSALKAMRTPSCLDEYAIHSLVSEALLAADIDFEHEKKLSNRSRIDFFAENVGIEIKKGKPNVKRLFAQLARYSEDVNIYSLILVVQGAVRLPPYINDKPCHILCLSRLWGIALP